jgi:hypothetical protein
MVAIDENGPKASLIGTLQITDFVIADVKRFGGLQAVLT